MPQLSQPGLRWRAGRAVATSRMYIVSNISYQCAPHGTSRRNAGSRPGSSPAAFMNLNLVVSMALTPTHRKPQRTLGSTGNSSCMAVRARFPVRQGHLPSTFHPRRRIGMQHRMRTARPSKGTKRVIAGILQARRHLRALACNRFQTDLAVPQYENDGVCRRFLPDWDSSLRN